MSKTYREIILEKEVRNPRTSLVLERARANLAYDDAYPEVGMQLPWKCYVNDALKQLGYNQQDVIYNNLVR